MRQALLLMERSPDERITGPLAREICQRSGLKAILGGSIGALGSHYVITLNAERCADGELIAGEQREAVSKEQVLTELGRAAASLRSRLGESLASIQKFDKPFDVTTNSLDALQAYSAAYRHSLRSEFAQSIPFYKEAVARDPDFAFAYKMLGNAYGNLGNRKLLIDNMMKAFALRDHASELERLSITGSYYYYALGDLKNAIETQEQGRQLFPRWLGFRANLATSYAAAGRHDDAAAEMREAVRLDPDSTIWRGNLLGHLVRAGRLEEAKAVLEDTKRRKLYNASMRNLAQTIAMVEGGSEGLQRQIESDQDRRPVRLLRLSIPAVQSGKMKEAARLLLDYRTQAADARGTVDSAILANFGSVPGFLGIRSGTNPLLTLLRSLTPTGETPYFAVLGLALSGDSRSARMWIDQMHQKSPEDTILNMVQIPTVNATLAIQERNPDKAIDLLRPAAAYEFGNFGLPAIYVRGWAYLEKKSGAEAAAEFQKITSHRILATLGQPVLYPLAHLGLAHAYALAGDLPNARRSYEEFFTIWKDADPDIPVLAEARQEYAKLAAKE